MSGARELIVPKAREFLGTKFQHQGRLKGRGIDCLGVPLCVAEELGIPDRLGRPILGSDYLNYPREPMDSEVLTVFCQPRLYEKNLRDVLPGDVLCFHVRNVACHIAIVTGTARFTILHAYPGLGRVTEHLIDAKWTARIAGAFSFLEV